MKHTIFQYVEHFLDSFDFNDFRLPIYESDSSITKDLKWAMVISINGKWRENYGVGYFVGMRIHPFYQQRSHLPR